MNDKIFKLVKDHFSLSEESLGKFEERFHNPFVDEILVPYINKENDYRFRVPLPEGMYKDFDNGWELLNNVTPFIIRKYKITYDDYYINKKVVDKNAFKIFKLIKQFFEDESNSKHYRSFIDNMQAYEPDKFRSFYDYCCNNNLRVSDLKNSERLISIFLDRLNELRFSKNKRIEVVLSLNYDDWFLSTTKENWRTCLSMESPTFASYWASLAGSIVDKNLLLVYITNGNKKTYQDVTVDKVLSRSWILLDKGSELNVVKFYPNELVSVQSMNSFLPLSIKNIDSSFVSKYRVVPLTYVNGYTNYLYQDKTKPFNINKEDSSFEMKYGGKGLYTIFKGECFEGPIFSYCDGVSSLSVSENEIIRYFNKPVRCSLCDALCSYHRCNHKNRNGEIYCDHCMNTRGNEIGRRLDSYHRENHEEPFFDEDYSGDDDDDDYDGDYDGDDDYDVNGNRVVETVALPSNDIFNLRGGYYNPNWVMERNGEVYQTHVVEYPDAKKEEAVEENKSVAGEGGMVVDSLNTGNSNPTPPDGNWIPRGKIRVMATPYSRTSKNNYDFTVNGSVFDDTDLYRKSVNETPPGNVEEELPEATPRKRSVLRWTIGEYAGDAPIYDKAKAEELIQMVVSEEYRRRHEKTLKALNVFQTEQENKYDDNGELIC